MSNRKKKETHDTCPKRGGRAVLIRNLHTVCTHFMKTLMKFLFNIPNTQFNRVGTYPRHCKLPRDEWHRSYYPLPLSKPQKYQSTYITWHVNVLFIFLFQNVSRYRTTARYATYVINPKELYTRDRYQQWERHTRSYQKPTEFNFDAIPPPLCGTALVPIQV